MIWYFVVDGVYEEIVKCFYLVDCDLFVWIMVVFVVIIIVLWNEVVGGGFLIVKLFGLEFLWCVL